METVAAVVGYKALMVAGGAVVGVGVAVAAPAVVGAVVGVSAAGPVAGGAFAAAQGAAVVAGGALASVQAFVMGGVAASTVTASGAVGALVAALL